MRERESRAFVYAWAACSQCNEMGQCQGRSAVDWRNRCVCREREQTKIWHSNRLIFLQAGVVSEARTQKEALGAWPASSFVSSEVYANIYMYIFICMQFWC